MMTVRPLLMRLALRVMAVVVLLGGCGCASSGGPQVITVSSAQYAQAFDAAVEAARRAGMPAAFRDRRAGVIDSEAHIAGSIIEPWRTDNASLKQAVENTIGFQRRRARFEFAPAEFTNVQGQDEWPAEHPQAAVNRAADLSTPLHSRQPARDLTAHQGDLEIRVWVFVERANAPGFRRGTWTRRTASRAGLITSQPQDPATISWTPVARDTAYEQRLLASIRSNLTQ